MTQHSESLVARSGKRGTKINPPNKKAPEVKGLLQRVAQPARLAHQFKPAVAQSKTPGLLQPKMAPAAPPAYRPQSVPKVLQMKTAITHRAVNQTPRQPIASEVHRSRPMPAALQLKKAEPQPSPAGLLRRQQIALPIPHAKPNKAVQPKFSMPRPLAASQTPKITTPHMTAMARVKGFSRATGVVQRAEVSASELKQMNPRYSVGLQATLNGVQIGNYISKSTKFGDESEHDHAEDGILHAIQSVVMTLELTGGKLAEGMGKAEVAIAKALTGNNVLLISNLTSSPCTTSTKVKKTSNKSAGEGCTEQLIDLASKGLDLKVDAKTANLKFKISIQADHYYQPGSSGPERELSKNASIDSVTRMKSAGIAVAITKT